MVLNLTIYLVGKAVIFSSGTSLAEAGYSMLGWTVVSFIAMYRFKVEMNTWIGVSALYGLIYFYSDIYGCSHMG